MFNFVEQTTLSYTHMNNLIITTTNSIENAKIEKYLGVVTTNLVIGTNFFSDFKASFTDFFGGMSGTYRKQMDTLYQRAYDALSIKASALGANCVLGFKIDFDELSGKGTQMFMISVSGTAVKIKQAVETSQNNNASNTSVSADKLNIEVFKDKWYKRNKAHTPWINELNFIMSNNLTDLAESLYDYFATERTTIEVRPIDEKFPTILSTLNYDEAVEVIYKDYENRHTYAYDLIKANKLFNAQKVLDILNAGNINLAISLLETEKPDYIREDVEVMEKILSVLDSLPDKGKFQEMKSGVFSAKLEEMYICPLGHKNNKDVVFCESTHNGGWCGLNIKGLNREQVDIIEAFRVKVGILKTLLA